MSFHYLGITRLQLFFDSPNLCAAFLCPLILLLIGLHYSCRTNKHIKSILFIVCIILLLMLFLTFSRGGWLGCFAGMCLSAFLLRKTSLLPWLWPSAFILLILLSNLGLSRFTGSSLKYDSSIGNRFKVWTGGCALIAKNWSHGVGLPPAVGEYYERHYQRHTSHGRYGTLVNDFLTLAASVGLPVAWLIATCLLSVYTACFHSDSSHEMAFHAYLTGAVLSYLVCGLFSTTFIYWHVLPPAFISMLFLIVHSSKNLFINLKKRVIPVCAFTCGVCCLIPLVGVIVENRISYYASIHNNTIWYEPRNGPVKKRIVVLTKEYSQIAQKWLIPLAENGYASTAVPSTFFFSSSTGYIINSLFPDDIFDITLLAIDNMSSINVFLLRAMGYDYPAILINSPDYWALEELSPRRNLPRAGQAPFFFLYDHFNISARHSAEVLHRECTRLGISSQASSFHPILTINKVLHILDNQVHQ